MLKSEGGRLIRRDAGRYLATKAARLVTDAQDHGRTARDTRLATSLGARGEA